MTETSQAAAAAGPGRSSRGTLRPRAALCLLSLVGLGVAPAVASAAASGLTKITLGRVSATEELSREPGAYVAVDPASDTVAVTGSVGTNTSATAGGRVWLVNGHTRRLSHTVDLPGAYLSSVADNSATGTFYVSDPDLTVAPDTAAGGIAVISARTGTITGDIPDPGLSGGIAADPKTNLVYATGPGYAVSGIDPQTKAVNPLGSGYILYPSSIAVDPASDVAYVISNTVVGVWFLNLSNGYLYGVSNTVRANINTNADAVGLANDPGTGRTFVALDTSNGSAVATIDGTSGRFATTDLLKNGNQPLSITVDTAKHDVYVGNVNQTGGCPDLVDEISEHTGKVVATVYNLADPESIAVDAKTGTVYVDNAGVLDAFPRGYSNTQKKCGTSGVVIGAARGGH